MSLSEHDEFAVTHAARLYALLVAGAQVFNNIHRKGIPLTFYEWSTQLSKIAQVGDALWIDNNQQRWLWDALRSEPLFKRRFGELPAATVLWTKKDQHFRVFPAGQWFVIGMKGSEVADLGKAKDRIPENETVSVRTQEPLDMKPGKGGRLECCDCQAEVRIRVDQTYSRQREADIMRVEESQILGIDNNVLTVAVASLNQAYTVSSRRLESERRSHGGRIYDHVFHINGSNRTLLEDIRRAVEVGKWNIP